MQEGIKKLLKVWLIKKGFKRSYKKRSSRLFELEGRLLNLYHGNFIEDRLSETGQFEPHISLLARHLINAGDVVFDVGANVGIHTITFSRLVGNTGKVIAFEPNKLNLERLNLNLALSNASNVSVEDSAVSEKPGTFTFYEFDDDSYNLGNHSLVKNETIEDFSKDEAIQTRLIKGDTIDNFCSFYNVTPKFIKMDIEGYEYYALQGASETLKKGTKLIIEFNSKRIRTIGLKNESFVDIFKDYNCYEIIKPDIIDEYSSLIPYSFDRDINCDLLCLPRVES